MGSRTKGAGEDDNADDEDDDEVGLGYIVPGTTKI